ncbi:hypothetical protein IFR05_012358 [Cadophora sp. M221]|nr:hypothetical protein IFR05_012358 [Cadophora sp. M221]
MSSTMSSTMSSAMPSTMKAWQYSKIHNTLEESLAINTSIPIPPLSSLSKNELLIEVIAAAINPVDYKLPESSIRQLVFGCFDTPKKYGACGQYLVAQSSECSVLPEGVSLDQAASIGTAGLTAYRSLLPQHVNAGSHVFINGGSGGVGTFSIQFAKAMGAKVTTTCSSANMELCKSLGADEVIDYKTSDIIATLKAKGQVFEAVIDNVGDSSALFNQCEAFLKPGGVFVQVAAQVTVVGMGGMVRKMFQPRILGGVGRKFHFVAVKSRAEDLEQVGKWMSEGKVKAVIGETFEFEDVPKAFEHLRTGHTKGKIVVHVSEN